MSPLTGQPEPRQESPITRDTYPVDHPSPKPPASTELAAVEAVVRDYIDGWHAGDPRQMERTLHDDLVKQTISRDASSLGELRRVPKSQMVKLTRDGGGASPDVTVDIVVHHVEGGIASARVATTEYLDHLHLAQTDGTWRIVHDLFLQRTANR